MIMSLAQDQLLKDHEHVCICLWIRLIILFTFDWVNSLAYSIKKENGNLRICLDPKDLNKAIKWCHHRTPSLEETTYELAWATHFSKLDAKNGYWSVVLDEESLLTTFNRPHGRHCFKSKQFGLVMSHDVFQQKMDQILEKCPGAIGIADDIIVFGKREQEHEVIIQFIMALYIWLQN